MLRDYFMKSILSILLINIGLSIIACNKSNAFKVISTESIVDGINDLREELIQAPYGWKVIYFPRTDSLIFSDINKTYFKSDNDNQQSSYGGFYFIMRFSDNGTVQMQADFDAKSLVSKTGEFQVKQNTFTQLSFTSYNYIHRLTNSEFNGSSDFLYVGKDFFGRHIFRTASYIEPAREYIVFEKLQHAQDTAFITHAYTNRRFFDNMINPQLCIHKGSRIFYKSDVFQKSTSDFNKNSLANGMRTRYYVFSSSKVLNPLPDEFEPLQSFKLGSGYVGTERGILFYSGIRYDKKNIFYDFQKQDKTQKSQIDGGCSPNGSTRFVCELVEVYDSINRISLLVPKHLAPHGVPTYLTAEIYDDTSAQYFKKIPDKLKYTSAHTYY